MPRRIRNHCPARCAVLFLFVSTLPTLAQTAQLNCRINQASGNAPLTLTLQDALARAKGLNPEYHAAATEAGLAKEDRVQSRAGLLPSASYNSSFIYTEGNGTTTGRFIANNAVHEYLDQGDVHQSFSLAQIADYRRTLAAEAAARARLEIAARGLVVTVVEAYYGFVVAQRKYATAERAGTEAQYFFDITQKLEQGGEVAHSDVIKAQIQLQQQQRELQNARLEMERSRIDLAVLVFPDFNENFSTVDDLQTPRSLPAFAEAQAAAADHNPEIRAALASFSEAKEEVKVAWNGFLPSLSIDWFYGIDASAFATRFIDPILRRSVQGLGYAGTATLELPVWNWGANRSRVRQAELQREQARVELTFAQRQLLGNLRKFYEEAEVTRSQLQSLQSSAQLAADSLRLTTLRYQAGEVSVLEVVDAQNTLTLAQNAFDDGEVRYRVALANLQTLTGSF